MIIEDVVHALHQMRVKLTPRQYIDAIQDAADRHRKRESINAAIYFQTLADEIRRDLSIWTAKPDGTLIAPPLLTGEWTEPVPDCHCVR